MKHLPSRLRRLDDALAALPVEEPMLLSELDGYLTGLVVSPDAIAPDLWLQGVWGIDDGGPPPFEDPADVRWFRDAVLARQAEIARDLDRGKPRPLFDTDERNGDLLWDDWIDGFAEAMALRPDAWAALATGGDPDVAKALSTVSTLIAVARGESPLDSMEINALHDAAPALLATALLSLRATRPRADAAAPEPTVARAPAMVGRNAPCPCGSGRKSKQCCR